MSKPSSKSSPTGLSVTSAKIILQLEALPNSLISIVARLGIIAVFWSAAFPDLKNWQITDQAVKQFRFEWLAYSVILAELLFPALLVIGLASRLSALFLFFLSFLMIVFLDPPHWPDHIVKAAALFFLFARGPGKLSIDYLIRKHVL